MKQLNNCHITHEIRGISPDKAQSKCLWGYFSLIYFFSGYSGFHLSSKTNISKFQFDQESGGRTIMWMYYLQIIIYLFIFIY